MAVIFAKKIKEKAINPMTNAAWTIDDVPARWQTVVISLLAD